MELVLAITLGVLYAAGAYLLLRRSVVRLILGVVLLGHAANLLIFTAAGLRSGGAVFVPAGAAAPPIGAADPLPQALILTAIVISFGVLAFTVVMIARAHRIAGSDDVDALGIDEAEAEVEAEAEAEAGSAAS